MPDRDTKSDKSAPGRQTTPHTDDQQAPQDPDLGQQADPDSQKSTTSRPRGHTEEPDRTL
jgi:hypothetical protein